jgi:hypothetical protein
MMMMQRRQEQSWVQLLLWRARPEGRPFGLPPFDQAACLVEGVDEQVQG